MKKKLLMMAIVVVIVSIFTVGTSFAGWFYNVNLVKSDAGTAGTILTIANDSGTVLAQKYLATEIEKTGLAVALSAQAMGQKVHVYVDTGLNRITEIVLSTEQ